jgi:hypothetical protein
MSCLRHGIIRDHLCTHKRTLTLVVLKTSRLPGPAAHTRVEVQQAERRLTQLACRRWALSRRSSTHKRVLLRTACSWVRKDDHTHSSDVFQATHMFAAQHLLRPPDWESCGCSSDTCNGPEVPYYDKQECEKPASGQSHMRPIAPDESRDLLARWGVWALQANETGWSCEPFRKGARP